MNDYNASDTKSIRKAEKHAKQAEADRRTVVCSIMSNPLGRSWVHDRLLRCHCFTSSFSTNALTTAFNEGERNIGLQDLADIMQFAPDQYIQMMREFNDRNQADGRRSNDSRTSLDRPAYRFLLTRGYGGTRRLLSCRINDRA